MRRFIICMFVVTMFLCKPVEAVVSTLVADAKTGTIYTARNSSYEQYPASLTKVMTLYLTFNALDKGLLKMDDVLPVSLNAAKQPRSKLFLKAGDTIRVKEAVMALIIKSANDVAVVLAEALAPSEEEFAQMMTQTAHKLGMKNTFFKNASGLHHPEQVTTAQDMALLTMAMINHYPQYYKLFSAKSFWHKGKEHKTHNKVTLYYKGAEGLKTGYIAAVGYNIISTAKRNNNRMIAVVIGQNKSDKRDKQAVNLLDKGFNHAQKPKSVLMKLKKQGKYIALNKDLLQNKPNLSPQIKTMKKRLAITKKQANDIQRVRLEKYEKTGVLAKLSSPVQILPDETAQGDDSENLTLNEEIKTMSQSDTETTAQKIVLANQILETTDVAGLNPLRKEDVTSSENVFSDEDILAITAELADATDAIQTDNNIAKETGVLNNYEKNLTSVSAKTNNHIHLKQDNDVNKTSVSEKKKQFEIALKKQNWGVQVGAFREKTSAQKQADKAHKFVRLGNTSVQITQKDDIFRSRIYGFKNKKEAQQACRKLKNKNINCLPLAPVS